MIIIVSLFALQSFWSAVSSIMSEILHPKEAAEPDSQESCTQSWAQSCGTIPTIFYFCSNSIRLVKASVVVLQVVVNFNSVLVFFYIIIIFIFLFLPYIVNFYQWNKHFCTRIFFLHIENPAY